MPLFGGLACADNLLSTLCAAVTEDGERFTSAAARTRPHLNSCARKRCAWPRRCHSWFAPEHAEDKRHRYAWVPFGGGVHNCIGMHFSTAVVETVLHRLLERYEWSVDPGYEMPWDRYGLPTPADGLPIRLHGRDRRYGITSAH